MNYEPLETFRRKLLGRRVEVMKRRDHALSDEQEIAAEREPDWEDEAANVTAAELLERLGEAERAAVNRIDAALERMERGTYGECIVCGAPIELDRLEAIPETDRCGGCALKA
jgi:RNA polymerase-binding protein DksA